MKASNCFTSEFGRDEDLVTVADSGFPDVSAAKAFVWDVSALFGGSEVYQFRSQRILV